MQITAEDAALRRAQSQDLLSVIQRGGLAEGEMVSDVFGSGITDMSSNVNSVINEVQNTAMMINNGISVEDQTYRAVPE
jgi:hypothetical protein